MNSITAFVLMHFGIVVSAYFRVLKDASCSWIPCWNDLSKVTLKCRVIVFASLNVDALKF